MGGEFASTHADGELHASGTELAGIQPESEMSFEDAVAVLNRSFGVDTGLTSMHLKRLGAWVENRKRLLRGFRPGVFEGDLLFFSAAQSLDDAGERKSAEIWRPAITGAIREHVVDCAHIEMTTPQACAVIGPVLDSYLAERTSAPPPHVS